MAGQSSIEWTETTWNPLAGCSMCSPGCANCYAARLGARLEAMGQPKYADTTRKVGGTYVWTGIINLDEQALRLPSRWRRPRTIFVDSMSDLFHEHLGLDVIQRVFAVMRAAPQHRYQILTKRSARLCDLNDQLAWGPQIWMGVSVEHRDYTLRIDHLRATDAAVKFVSLEPLLGPLPNLNLNAIDWVIVGGESGPGARPMRRKWVIDIRDQCRGAGVPFFFKQWGGVNKKKTGRRLEGRTWEEMPTTARVSAGAAR